MRVTQDPPTGVRWESVRLAEPLVLRRPWRAPWLERPDGTALPTDGSGARLAQGAGGEPVRVAPVFSFLQMGWMLGVDGRPVPATAPVSKSTGLGLFTGMFAAFALGGGVAAAAWYVVCCSTIAVRRCEGDPTTRRSQAITVAIVGAVIGIVVDVLGVLATASLGPPVFVLFGPLGIA